MGRTPLVLALAASLLIASTACTQQIKGSARADPVKAPVELVKDGFGIKLGFDDAPIQLELYTEPQCNHCADLQADFGAQMLSYINLGQLALTYRPVTFLDAGANQHSERVANAMFAAISPKGAASASTTSRSCGSTSTRGPTTPTTPSSPKWPVPQAYPRIRCPASKAANRPST
jgi:protein-disulfide isomerase